MLKQAIFKMSKVFEPQVLLRGQDYFQKGQVLNIRLSDGLLKGRVKGSSSQIYDVYMDLRTWPTRPSHCTCPYHSNCKHAAACLFGLRDREQSTISQSSERLDKKLDMWIKNLRVQEENLVKQENTHFLHYLIDLKLDHYEHRVSIRLAFCKLLKRGGFGKRTILNSITESKKQYFTPEDNDIVAQLLFKAEAYHWFHDLIIRNSELLAKIIATGRAFFNETPDAPIRMGEETKGECSWRLSANGYQHLSLMREHQEIIPLLLDQCWYFNTKENLIGRLTTSYTMKQLGHLLQVPAIPLDQAELLAKKMVQVCPEFPLPQIFKERREQEVLPQAVLLLDAYIYPETTDNVDYNSKEHTALFVAKVVFDYAGVRISYKEKNSHVVNQQGSVLLQYKRNSDFEHSKFDELSSVLTVTPVSMVEQHNYQIEDSSCYALRSITMSSNLESLYNNSIPELKNRGWQIEFLSPLYQQVLGADEVEWYSDLREETHDFFSYELGILVDEHPVSIVPLVADLIRKYKSDEIDSMADTHLVQLPIQEGKILQLQMGRIKPLVRLLLQLGLRHLNEHDELKMSKYQLLLMQETELALAATRARWQGSEQFRKELKQLAQLLELPDIIAPAGLKAQLRDYQLYGLKWLQLLRTCKFSGILADDMGLGKTVQTLAHLLYEKEQGRIHQATLIIAPTSLVGNWLAEAKRFAPSLKVLIYHGSDRHEDHFDDFDLVITTYGLLQRDKEKFTAYFFYYLILDEAQFIKNAKTKTTQIIHQLKASHRLCLTGTPLENHLGELWSLFHFLMPGLLGDVKQFRTWFRTPIEKNGDLERRELLVKRVQPFMLRRTKNEVAKELPSKTEILRTIDIVGSQRDLYETIRMSMEKKVRDAIAKQGLGKSHILLLDALLKLRQICCDPRLLSLPEAKVAHECSSKLDTLMELLHNLMEEGRRVLIFSQFTSMLELIEKELEARQYTYLKLTGQTQNRQTLVERFQEGNIPIFLISLKAGGTGLNLTRADTVIHYDPWWNPAVEDQATDRSHRIGQENPVFVYKLITSGTVEEVILGMQERKRQLVNGILGGDGEKGGVLKVEDIDQLFMPLS